MISKYCMHILIYIEILGFLCLVKECTFENFYLKSLQLKIWNL